jgi:hypothetical protein
MDLKDLQAVLTFSIGFRVFRFLRIKGRAMRRKTAANNRERERERERGVGPMRRKTAGNNTESFLRDGCQYARTSITGQCGGERVFWHNLNVLRV